MDIFKSLQENETKNDKWLIVVISLLVIFFLVYLIKRLINKKISDTDNKYKSRKIVNVFGSVLFISVLIFTFNDRLGGLGIALGVAGAGIAFALQEVIVSIAGWLSIVFTGTIKTGNRVEIGGIKGDIIDIGILKTTLMQTGDWIEGDLYNGKIVTIANSFVFKNPVFNYSGEFPFLWDEIQIPIRLDSDYHAARKLFQNILDEECGQFVKESEPIWNKLTDKYRVENAKVKSMLSLKFDENWISFTLRFVVDYKKRRTTKNIIYTRILDEIKKSQNINIASSSIEIVQKVVE